MRGPLVSLPPARFFGFRLVVALVVVGLHLDHVAGLDLFDGLVAGLRQDWRSSDEADEGEGAGWLSLVT
jgi:hypothetical protein